MVRLGTHTRISESEVDRLLSAGTRPACLETVAPKDLNETQDPAGGHPG